MTRRRCPTSPAPPPAVALPLYDEDLLSEILLRLPPQPSSLPRASFVCKRWRRLVSDPQFFSRFRAHHRKPPLLGFFEDYDEATFTPTLDPPDRIPTTRFSLQRCSDDNLHKDWTLLDCRHGLALLLGQKQRGALVWDPATGLQRRVALPPELDDKDKIIRNAAVLRAAAGDDGHRHGGCPFQVVLVCTDEFTVLTRAFACVYSSESGKWGKIVSTAVQSIVSVVRPSTLVGNRLYWLLMGSGILEFDLNKQSLAVIEKPTDRRAESEANFQIMPAKDGGIGLAIVSDYDAQLWERKADSGGLAVWVLLKTIRLCEILGLGSRKEGGGPIYILGFAEDVNVILLWTGIGVFMVQLESMYSRKLFESNLVTTYYPYSSLYAAGMGIGGGHDGPEMLPNAVNA